MAKPKQTKSDQEDAALIKHLKQKYPDFKPANALSLKEKKSFTLRFILANPTRDGDMSELYSKHILGIRHRPLPKK